MRTKLDTELLAIEQNNDLTKIVNAYIVYDLDAWPRNPSNSYKFKHWLFVATSIVKVSIIKRSMCIADTE